MLAEAGGFHLRSYFLYITVQYMVMEHTRIFLASNV